MSRLTTHISSRRNEAMSSDFSTTLDMLDGELNYDTLLGKGPFDSVDRGILK
jgi:hypothetical protein